MDVYILQAWVTAIGNVGFPAVLAIYLLIRFEKKIDMLQSSIQDLAKVNKNSIENSSLENRCREILNTLNSIDRNTIE